MQEIKKIPIILYSKAFYGGINICPSIRQAAENAKCTEGELKDAIFLGSAIKHNSNLVKIDGYEIYADYILSENNLGESENDY